MVAHEVFAEISEGVVQNVIVAEDYTTANWIAKQAYGENAFAVSVTQYPCHIGDRYRDSCFYRVDENGNEIEIEPVPTDQEEIRTLKIETTASQLALVDQYERNEALQEELTETQMALVDMYEGMEALLNG